MVNGSSAIRDEDIQRVLLDWVVFAFSPVVAALPSSFALSAFCTFSPRHQFLVAHRSSASAGCGEPLACAGRWSGTVCGPHPCGPERLRRVALGHVRELRAG